MKQDNIYLNLEARESFINGIRKCSQAVGSTMGTAGSNAILQTIERPGYLLTNDGISILRAIKLASPIEDMAREALLDAVERANKQSGDGSSTATVLTAAIIEHGMKYVHDYAPMDIKNSLEDCLYNIEQSIAKQKKDISISEIGKVATISSEDEKVGNLIQEIYEQIGKDGIINWDISKTAEDSYSLGLGIHIEGAGYASPYMCDIDDKTNRFLPTVRLKKPKILLVKQKITSGSDLNSISQSLFNKDIKELVIFCDEIEAPAISDLILTRAQRGFRVVVVRMPVIWKDQWYEDLSLATGAKIVDTSLGLPLKTATLEHLGEVNSIVIGKEDVSLDGIRDISEHIARLNEGDDDAKVRAARLNTKTARYFVGANSESALSYRRLKVEDAISASWQALHGGVVAGGGVAMINCISDLPDTVGGKILKEALEEPLLQITKNAKINVSLDKVGGTMGYDTRTKQLVDMFESNIINPANVEINACKNAISVAATALTVNTITTFPQEDKASNQFPVMM